MKRILMVALVGGVALACAGTAQQVAKAPVVAPRITAPVTDSVSFKASPELQKALDELAASVQALASRIANDPQLRAAAFQVASGAIATAHQVVTEQSGVLEEAFKTAAKRIADAEAAHRARQKRP